MSTVSESESEKSNATKRKLNPEMETVSDDLPKKEQKLELNVGVGDIFTDIINDYVQDSKENGDSIGLLMPLVIDMSDDIKPKKPNAFECTICSKTFAKRFNRNRHMETVHKMDLNLQPKQEEHPKVDTTITIDTDDIKPNVIKHASAFLHCDQNCSETYLNCGNIHAVVMYFCGECDGMTNFRRLVHWDGLEETLFFKHCHKCMALNKRMFAAVRNL